MLKHCTPEQLYIPLKRYRGTDLRVGVGVGHNDNKAMSKPYNTKGFRQRHLGSLRYLDICLDRYALFRGTCARNACMR